MQNSRAFSSGIFIGDDDKSSLIQDAVRPKLGTQHRSLALFLSKASFQQLLRYIFTFYTHKIIIHLRS